MNKNKILLVAVVCVLAFQVSAQKNIKSFYELSKAQATKVITDSPWATTYQSPPGLPVKREPNQVANDQAAQTITPRISQANSSRRVIPAPVVIRLNSAPQIRQALIRLQQIASNYDKMDERERAKFDDASKGFLDCAACENYYVITITRFKDAGESIDEGIFQTTKFKDIKDKVYLSNEKGEKRELVNFIPPTQSGESAVFFFNRFNDEGKPLITLENKKLEFVFTSDFLDTRNPYGLFVPSKFEFNVSKLIVDGKVAF